MKVLTEAELIELENELNRWGYSTRERFQVLIDLARTQAPPISPMPPRKGKPGPFALVEPKPKNRKKP